jgi:hypothetical protein
VTPEGIKPVGKPILLATPICYKYKTVLAPTLSEYNPTARMSGKRFCDTTRVSMEALGSGNALRWFPQLKYKKHKKIMVTILIHEFHSFVSVKILDGGEFPRVRTTGRLDGLHKILKNELAHFKQMGIEVSFARKNGGKFGGIKWKDIAKLR